MSRIEDLVAAARMALGSGDREGALRVLAEVTAATRPLDNLRQRQLEIGLAHILAVSGRTQEATAVLRRLVERATSEDVEEFERDVARYALAEHLVGSGDYTEVPAIVAPISPTSVVFAHAKALAAVALAELRMPEAAQVASEAVDAADNDQLRRVLHLLGRHAPPGSAERLR